VRCPLCDFELAVEFDDARATGFDVTPYAKAYARGEPGFREMVKWVWLAGWRRLKHIALMRASAASGRFARINLVVLAGAFALFEATQKGWVTSSVRPAGRGWLRIVASPRSLPQNHPPEAYVDLWWNITHTVIAVAIVMSVGWLLLWLVTGLIGAGVTWAHKPPYRYEQRMTAAVHYATAWCLPFFAAGIIVALRLISDVGRIAGWKWYPPQLLFEFSAAVVAGFGATLWWFWLFRLSATAPDRTRGRVVAFFALGVPVLVGSAAAGWCYLVEPIYPLLFEKLGVNF
jgi:hypothetical protein